MKESLRMRDKERTYLERRLEATLTKNNNSYSLLFYREKVKLNYLVEIDLLKTVDVQIQKDLQLKEDELLITIDPPQSFVSCHHFMKEKNERMKWLFAHQLVKKVQTHSISRLTLVVCPENIVVDPSCEPYFLHYGVQECIPPYESDSDLLFREVKATVASVIHKKHSFEQYLNLSETLQLNALTKKIMEAKSLEALSVLINKQIDLIDKTEKTLISMPKQKWKAQKYVSIGLIILLIPAFIYFCYSVFFHHPKQQAFIDSSEYFLNKEYSEVIHTLDRYKIESMPRIIQYKLATSYVLFEALTEDQKNNVLHTLTLQSDPNYYKYWINIGRGENEEALDIARRIEDRDLILFALLKHREEVKANQRLSGAERQQLVNDLQREIDEYMSEQPSSEGTESDLDSNDQQESDNDETSEQPVDETDQVEDDDDSGEESTKEDEEKSKKAGNDKDDDEKEKEDD